MGKNSIIDSALKDSPSRFPSKTRIWLCILMLLLFDGLVQKLFGKIIDWRALNDVPRYYYQTVTTTGLSSALENLVVHWLPRAILLFIATILLLRCLRIDWRNIFRTNFVTGTKTFLIALVFLALYHTSVRFILKASHWIVAPGAWSNPLAFMGLYVLRFLPSAFAEEVVYRGGVLTMLRSRYGIHAAVVLSLLMSSVGHLYGGPWLFVNSLILGVVFTILYIKTGSVVPGSIAHTTSNVIYALLNY